MFDDLIDNKKVNDHPAEKAKLTKGFPLSASSLTANIVQPGQGGTSLGQYSEKIEKEQKLGQKFETKISELRQKGKKRGKKYSVIGISLSIFIFIGVIFIGNVIIKQVNSISDDVDQQESNLVLSNYIDPDNRCQNDNCCLASLEKITKNKFPETRPNSPCPVGEELKFLNCENSLYWCQQVDVNADDRAQENEKQILNEEALIDKQFSSTSPEFSSSSDFAELDLDSDNDGLMDSEEKVYGTEILNPDTDGDGFLDGDEVRNGYNPAGEGYL